MYENLRNTYYRLIDELDIGTFRYLYNSFSVDERLTGLIGPRGVGKTTLLLQFIKNKLASTQDAFYFSADHIYFNKNTLLDFVGRLYEEEDVRLFFIDEIHKYKNWNQELKNIYDSFPRIKIVFSGSSSLDLVERAHDLSRRAVMHYMTGLSFREYLNFTRHGDFAVIDFDHIINNPVAAAKQFAKIPKLRGYFRDYLRQGYYPFVFEGGHFFAKLEAVINKTIYEDIANYYKLKTENLHYFKKILAFLATIPPGTMSINNLAGNLGIDSKTTLHYVYILQRTGLLRILNSNKTGARLLRTPEKVFLENTTLLNGISDALGQKIDIGTQRELAFVSAVANAGKKVYCRKKNGDFIIDDIVFEIGGKNKTMQQIRTVKASAFLVKDDILNGGKKTIPLYLFGFLY